MNLVFFHFFPQEYFFRWLHDMLAEMPEVTELHPVPDAHVPVLGFKINGVSIDLLYANLAHAMIPEASLCYIIAVCINFVYCMTY
jgi:poly(A) polymerase